MESFVVDHQEEIVHHKVPSREDAMWYTVEYSWKEMLCA